MRCPCCGYKLTRENKFCPECGAVITVERKENNQAPKKKANRTIVVIGIVLLVVGLVVGAVFALGGEGVERLFWGEVRSKTEPFSSNPEAISLASQSVVKLSCYDRSGSLCATGSGFACFAECVIVTNYHVISDGVYKVKVSTEQGLSFDIGHVIAVDKDRDIAILTTAAPHRLALLQPGNSIALQKGEKVVAIGSPLGLLNSVSTGVFSGYRNENNMDVLQFTAAISSGSSGGALFNDAGEVLGITFASYEAGQNLNLAVPITEVQRIWEMSLGEHKTFSEFYYSEMPTYRIDEVLSLGDSLVNREFYVEGCVFSHNVGQLGNGVWRGWCTVYPWTSSLPSKKESHSLENDLYMGTYVQIVDYSGEKDDNFANKMRSGDWVKFRCIYDISEYQSERIVLTLVNVEKISRAAINK